MVGKAKLFCRADLDMSHIFLVFKMLLHLYADRFGAQSGIKTQTQTSVTVYLPGQCHSITQAQQHPEPCCERLPTVVLHKEEVSHTASHAEA